METTEPRRSQWHSKNPVKSSEIMGALDPQELPDWPLLSLDICCLKCKLCSRRYYSTINFRRHECFHVRRRNNPDWLSDIRKKNSSFEEFWHERSRDIIKDIFSLQDVEPKGVTWHRIVEELASIPKTNIRLPRAYFRDRNVLLDTVKSKEPGFSISPDKFLELLSGGSEKTFLDNDMDESVQRHVFRDAEKIALAQENLVATACFLLEQKLRKAWHAHCKDETASLQNELIMEEEDEKTRQPKTEGNKVEGKKRKKKKKPKKQIVEDKSEEENLGQTSYTQQSTATSRPELPTSVEENSLTPVAQLEHLTYASHIHDAKQEDGECKHKEEGSKEQKSEEGKKKKKNKKNKKQIAKDKSEEGNLGQTSDIQKLTATSIPEVPTSVEKDSQTPVAQLPDASHIHDAKKEDGECKQEEPKIKELSCQTESNVEDDKETSELLSTKEVCSSSAPSQVGFEGQLPLEAKLPSANELVPVCSEKDIDTEPGQKIEIKQMTGGQIDKAGNFSEGAEKASQKLLYCENSATVTEEDLQSQVTESDQLTSSPITYSDSRENAEEISTGQHFGASTHPGTGSHSRSQLSSSGKNASWQAQSCYSDQQSADGHLVEHQVYSDHDYHQLFRDRFRRHKSSKAVQKSSLMRGKSAPPRMQRVPKVIIPKKIEPGKCGKKDATVERMLPSGQHETGAASSVRTHHKTRKIIDSEVGGCSISVRTQYTDGTDHTSGGSEEDAPIAPLSVDDLNNVQADLARAWVLILSRRHNQDQNQS